MTPHTLAASIEGGFLYFLIFIAISVVNWWLEKKKKAEQERAHEDSEKIRMDEFPAEKTPLPQAESDQDRARRFLEALGVPQNQLPPASTRPIPAPRHHETVPSTRSENRKRTRPIQRPRRPQPPIFQEPTPHESHEPATHSIPQQKFDKISEQFDALSAPATPSSTEPSRDLPIATQATESLPVPDFDYTIKHPPSDSIHTSSILEMLRNPQSLKNAILTREILGPPPGLQN